MTLTRTAPIMLHRVQADELRQLLTAVLGWLVAGDPAAHADLARHLTATAGRHGGPLTGAGPDTLALFESFLDVYTVILDPETHL